MHEDMTQPQACLYRNEPMKRGTRPWRSSGTSTAPKTSGDQTQGLSLRLEPSFSDSTNPPINHAIIHSHLPSLWLGVSKETLCVFVFLPVQGLSPVCPHPL